MTVEEAKEWIINNCNPKELALMFRREYELGSFIPVRWTEHREGGGVIIDSAEIDFTNCKDNDIVLFALTRRGVIKFFKKHHDKTFTEILEIFDTKIKTK